MKTSNKILLFILAVFIVCIFAVNVILKVQLDKKSEINASVKTDTAITSDSDSLAMRKAIENE